MLRSTGPTPRLDLDAPPAPSARDQVAAALSRFARDFGFALRVPGAHPSGPTYDQLIEWLAAQGRDFTADSPRLREHVRMALLAQFGDDRRVPGRAQLQQIIAAAVAEWVLLRLEMGQRDVPIKANAPAYRRWKLRHRPFSRPGMATGALRDALRDRARVRVEIPRGA